MSAERVQSKPLSGSESRVKLGRTLPMLSAPYEPSDNTSSNSDAESSTRASGKKKKGRASGSEPWGWARLPGEAFNLRVGPNYALNKRKAPSAPALYDCASVDYFGFEKRPDYVADKLSLPPLSPELRALVPKLAELGIPADIILNLQFPRKIKSSMFSSRCDGEGALFIVLLRIKVETAKLCLQAAKESQAEGNAAAANSNVPPSIRLLQRTFAKADDDPDHNLFGIFKQVARVANMDEVIHKVPTILRPLTSLNGKPRLLRTMQFRRLGGRAVEVLSGTFDSNIIMRKAMMKYKNKMGDFVLDLAWCLEGQNDEEQPEQVLGCFQLVRADFSHASQFPFECGTPAGHGSADDCLDHTFSDLEEDSQDDSSEALTGTGSGSSEADVTR